MPSSNSRLPSLLFEDILSGQGATVDPAGSSPRLNQQVGPAWPPSGVIPELNHVWLNPGAYLEPGTGFGARGSSSAIQNQVPLRQFPNFQFMFPPFMFGFGMQGVPEENPLMQGEGGGDGIEKYLAAALEFLEKFQKGLPTDAAQELNTEPWFEEQFGKDPTYTLSGDETEPVIDTSQFNLGTEPLPTLDFEGLPAPGNVFDPDNIAALVDATSGTPPPPVFNLQGDVLNPGSVSGIEGGFNFGGRTGQALPDLFPEGMENTVAGAGGLDLTNLGANAGIAALSVGAPLVAGELGATPNQQRLSSFGATQAGTAAALALGLSNPVTAIPAFIAAFASMAGPRIMREFGIGGSDHRAAQDAQWLQGMTQNRQQLLSIAQHSPELLTELMPMLNQTDFTRFEEIERNNRLPPDAMQQVRQFLQATNPIVNDMGFAPHKFDTPVLDAKGNKQVALRPNLPKELANLPKLSEGETWKLQEIARQRREQDHLARLIEEARARGEFVGPDGR